MGRNQQLPGDRQLDVSTRVDLEAHSLQRMEALWRQGVERLRQAVPLAPAHQAEAQRQLGCATFMLHAVVTAIHTQRWWTLKRRLLAIPSAPDEAGLLDETAALAKRELANAAAAIPLVRADSRLGWEPTMGCVTDEAHLRWKLAHPRRVLDHELPQYRAGDLAPHPPVRPESRVALPEAIRARSSAEDGFSPVVTSTRARCLAASPASAASAASARL